MNNFGNNNTKNSFLENTNSRGITFLNTKAEVKSALAIAFWNEMVSFRWHPPLPEEQRTEKKFFNYDESISTSLPYTKLMTLLNAIKKKIIPAINEGVKKSVGVPISDNTAAMVVSSGENGRNPYIAIYKDLSPERIPTTQMVYIFDTAIVINEYDPKTGNCEVVNDELAEFNTFIQYIEASLVGMCNATYHNLKHNDRYFRNKIAGGESSSGYTRKNNNVWGDTSVSSSNNSMGETEYSATTQSYKNVDDLNEFM